MTENELQPKLSLTETTDPISTDTPLPKVTTNFSVIPAEQIIKHEHHTMPKHPEIKVTLKRGTKGDYGWEITYNGTDSEFIVSKIKYIDEKLRKLFLEVE